MSINFCMEFSQDFPHPEINFCKMYTKFPHMFSKYFHNSNKIFVNIFIEITLTLIKSDLKFNQNVAPIFQKFLTT